MGVSKGLLYDGVFFFCRRVAADLNIFHYRHLYCPAGLFMRRGALGVNKCAKQDALLFVEQNEQRAGHVHVIFCFSLADQGRTVVILDQARFDNVLQPCAQPFGAGLQQVLFNSCKDTLLSSGKQAFYPINTCILFAFALLFMYLCLVVVKGSPV